MEWAFQLLAGVAAAKQSWPAQSTAIVPTAADEFAAVMTALNRNKSDFQTVG